jgi:hypothetical protein
MYLEDLRDWADDHGYSSGRCKCGRRTWSDTGVFDCGCGWSEPAIEDWQLVSLDDLDEIPAIGNEHVAEPFRTILNTISKPVVRVSTPCSCQGEDTRTCFLHGEVA